MARLILRRAILISYNLGGEVTQRCRGDEQVVTTETMADAEDWTGHFRSLQVDKM